MGSLAEMKWPRKIVIQILSWRSISYKLSSSSIYPGLVSTSTSATLIALFFLSFIKTSTCISRNTYFIDTQDYSLNKFICYFLISVCLIVHIAGTRPWLGRIIYGHYNECTRVSLHAQERILYCYRRLAPSHHYRISSGIAGQLPAFIYIVEWEPMKD